MKKHDRLYQSDSVPEDFSFSEPVVEVFDDMLARSVPLYQEVIEATAGLLDRHLKAAETICDLGCATGTTLLHLARCLRHKSPRLVGVDSSEPMLTKAWRKASGYSGGGRLEFRRQDIATIAEPDCGAFILHYTLQFIRPPQRPSLIARLFDNLRPGGLLIISEKTIVNDKRLNRTFIDIHYDFKRTHGYSELEIAKKREALENVLVPFSRQENETLLQEAGFSPVEPFLQWFNFYSLIGIKPH
jgi:tRNA (cmo5U34)-methyltransferase